MHPTCRQVLRVQVPKLFLVCSLCFMPVAPDVSSQLLQCHACFSLHASSPRGTFLSLEPCAQINSFFFMSCIK